MPVALAHFKAKHGLDTEDLSLLFLENEVGRHRWRRNWPKWKAQFQDENALKQRIKTWLNYIEVEHDPREIIDHLDQMVANRAGKWL